MFIPRHYAYSKPLRRLIHKQCLEFSPSKNLLAPNQTSELPADDQAKRAMAALRLSSEVVFKEGGQFDADRDSRAGIEETQPIKMQKLRKDATNEVASKKSRSKSRDALIAAVDEDQQRFKK